MQLDKTNWVAMNRQDHILRNSHLVYYVAALLVAGFCIRKFLNRNKKFPVVGKPTDPDVRWALIEGVTKYPNTPFYLPVNPPLLITPKSTIQDIKAYHDYEASFNAILESDFHPKVTGVGSADPLLIAVVKNDISRQVASSLSTVQDEASYSFNKILGSSEDWSSHLLYVTLAEIVALVSSRVFVGRPLSREKEWVDATINYTFQILKTKIELRKWSPWIIPIIGPYLKETKSLLRLRDRGAELLKPIVDAHLAKEGNEKIYSDEGDEAGNCISWFLSRMGPGDRKDSAFLANKLLGLSFAAIHTTTNTAFQAILDLATYRHYIPILTDEIEQVILEDGYDISDDGILRMQKSSMPKLAKLDSFIKESQRINPLGLVSHHRRILTDVTLSTGHTIRKGTDIAIPAWYIHNNSDTLVSPGLTKSLDEFDGLRYYNLRKIPGNENRHQFVSTSQDSLAFGHGNHSCPGRFFAGNEIKVILIELLRNWEFRFPGDNKMEGGAWRRPKNDCSGLEFAPDTQARLEFRRKKRES